MLNYAVNLQCGFIAAQYICKPQKIEFYMLEFLRDLLKSEYGSFDFVFSL